MQTLINFDAPHNGSSTSRRAAESLPAETIGEQARRVLAFVQERGGSTREEISSGTGIRLSAVCGRVNSLVERGLLVPSGERKASSGRLVEVLVAKRFDARPGAPPPPTGTTERAGSPELAERGLLPQ